MRKAVKKNPRVWLARNDYQRSNYRLYGSIKKPGKNHYGEWEMPADENFCQQEFERMTNFRLKPGECKRVRIKIEVAK